MFYKSLAILLLPFLAFIRFSEIREYKIAGAAQGTSYQVTYYADNAEVTKYSIDSIFDSIDSSMSLYKPYSRINAFNSSDSGILVDYHFASVISKSFKVYRDSEGRFDVTIKPLSDLWGTGLLKSKQIPDSSAILNVLPYVGMHNIKLDGCKLTKSMPGVQIDLNGIAQGYTVDLIAEFLEFKGLNNFLVEVGGEIRTKGSKLRGEPFRIGIEGLSVENLPEEISHVINLSNMSVTSSGQLSQYVESQGKRYSHLINPKNGYPLHGEMVKISVIAKDAITADAYDNALMGMNVLEALKFVDMRSELEAYFIYRKPNGTISDTMSRGYRNYIHSSL